MENFSIVHGNNLNCFWEKETSKFNHFLKIEWAPELKLKVHSGHKILVIVAFSFLSCYWWNVWVVSVTFKCEK